MKTLLPVILRELQKGSSVAHATVLEAKGSAPRGAGACMLLTQAGETVGTVGGGILEYRALQTLTVLFSSPSPAAVSVAGLDASCAEGFVSAVEDYALTQDEVKSLGMVCGGNVSILYQVLSPELLSFFQEAVSRLNNLQNLWLVRTLANGKVVRLSLSDGRRNPTDLSDASIGPLYCRKTMLQPSESDPDQLFLFEPIMLNTHTYLFGCGHVSQCLAPLLSQLDFAPVAYDDRPEFANSDRFPTVSAVVCAPFPQAAEKLAVTGEDEIVIMTRGHANDLDILTFSLRTPAYYIGLIGSRSKIEYTRNCLLRQGFSESEFARVHTPIGLPILAETPMEIAVSVAAEMIRERAIRTGLKT